MKYITIFFSIIFISFFSCLNIEKKIKKEIYLLKIKITTLSKINLEYSVISVILNFLFYISHIYKHY